MTTAFLVLTLVVLAVWLSAARPTSRTAEVPPDRDRDRERQLGELRAMRSSRADVHL
jgi:hypothetical protein